MYPSLVLYFKLAYWRPKAGLLISYHVCSMVFDLDLLLPQSSQVQLAKDIKTDIKVRNTVRDGY